MVFQLEPPAPTIAPINPAMSSQALTTTRLHITPLTPELLKTYIPPSLLPSAENISYHNVQTFPEKSFGYVELPTADAEKLKKKYNGMTLKGKKVHIQDAKPEKWKKRQVEEEDGVDEKAEKRSRKKAKKEKEKTGKREDGVIPGVVLPADRKVKRGWTETPTEHKEKRVKEKREKKEKKSDDAKEEKKEKKRKKREAEVSKYTNEPEMLFRTKLPPTAVEAPKAGKDKKSKKSKREVVVHEFTKTKKPASFLKNEPITSRPVAAAPRPQAKEDEDESEDESEEEEPATVKKNKSHPPIPTITTSQPEEEESSGDESEEIEARQTIPTITTSQPDDEDSAESKPRGKEPADVEMEEEAKSPPSKAVHPLEALFKRPKPSNAATSTDASPSATSKPALLAPINTSFSFFDDDGDEATATSMRPPQTPFTRQDLEARGLRSAAPTPDTAVVGGRFRFGMAGHENDDNDDDENEEDGDEEDEDVDMTNAAESIDGPASVATKDEATQSENPEQNEFEKWFWENRGESNRAWKKRRRESMKEFRQRANKKLGKFV
ncbi:hypothetical protein K402DRAFT_392964 [Aulographum hederae CBS 113979]|uniref:RRM domain-containing protein n=1 Tax=Aulographum hederae CBS 113979 TaxID=1176131 RepID=A0A6G1H2I5_9PEZI|nr:hypothetical protein K402DRAFT_392964 [Aulographum hederae CBS 113979]